MNRKFLVCLVAAVAVLLPYTLKASEDKPSPRKSETISDLVYRDIVWDTTPPSQEPTLRLAQDEWFSHDKLDHLAGGMVTMSLTSLVWQPKTTGDVWQRAGVNIAAWALYEVKDGLFDWSPTKKWGGDGFSYKDAAWSAAGVLLVTSVILTAR